MPSLLRTRSRRSLLLGLLVGLLPAALQAAAPPPVPHPSWPVNGALVYSTAQPLTWYLGAEAVGISYDVRYRLASGVYPSQPQRTGLRALRYETSGLVPGAAYAWQVRACESAFSCSAWSAEATFTVNGGGSNGSSPVVPVTSWPVGGATVYASPATLTWYAPMAPAGTVYHVYTKTCATPSCAAELAAGAGATGYTDSGELATLRHAVGVGGGEGVVWYVRSRVGGVFSAPSALASFVRNGGPGSVSAVPSWPTGGAEMYTSTPLLSWWVMGGTSGVSGYEVCWGTASTAAATPMCAAPVVKDVREVTHLITTPLNWATTYYWHVRVAGTPGWATASFVTTGAAGTLTPTIAWPTGGAVLGSGAATLSWYVNGPAAPVELFEVELAELGELGGTTTYYLGGGARQRIVSGLVPGGTYTWRVRSYNGVGYSPWSDPAGTFSIYAPDGAAMPMAESPARGVVLPGGATPVLSWSMPAEAPEALTYEVEVASNAGMTGARRYEGVSTPHVALSALPAGLHYWRVRARTGAGKVSAFSPVAQFATAAATAAEASSGVSDTAGLRAVYPNPMRGAGVVAFALAGAAHVRVVLYDALGREVAVLVDGTRPAGTHQAAVEAARLPAGLYLVRMTVGAVNTTRALVVGG